MKTLILVLFMIAVSVMARAETQDGSTVAPTREYVGTLR